MAKKTLSTGEEVVAPVHSNGSSLTVGVNTALTATSPGVVLTGKDPDDFAWPVYSPVSASSTRGPAAIELKDDTGATVGGFNNPMVTNRVEFAVMPTKRTWMLTSSLLNITAAGNLRVLFKGRSDRVAKSHIAGIWVYTSGSAMSARVWRNPTSGLPTDSENVTTTNCRFEYPMRDPANCPLYMGVDTDLTTALSGNLGTEVGRFTASAGYHHYNQVQWTLEPGQSIGMNFAVSGAADLQVSILMYEIP